MLYKQISRVDIYIYMVGKIKITDHMLVIFCFPTLEEERLLSAVLPLGAAGTSVKVVAICGGD